MWSAHRAEYYRIGVTAQSECVLRQRRAHGVEGRTADWCLAEFQPEIELFCDGCEHAGRLSGHLATDTITGQDDDG